MGRISAYEAADGQIFKDRGLYIKHSRDLVAASRMRALIEAQVSDEAVAKAVGDFYAANASALRDLLNSKDITLDGNGDDDENAGDPVTPPVVQPVVQPDPLVPGAPEPEGI